MRPLTKVAMERESKAVEEGIDAYCLGVPRHACPYPPSTKAYYDWLVGWDEAEAIEFEEEKNQH